MAGGFNAFKLKVIQALQDWWFPEGGSDASAGRSVFVVENLYFLVKN